MKLGGIGIPARGLVNKRNQHLRTGTDQEQRYDVGERARLREIGREITIHDQRRGTTDTKHHEPRAQGTIVLGIILVVALGIALTPRPFACLHADLPEVTIP